MSTDKRHQTWFFFLVCEHNTTKGRTKEQQILNGNHNQRKKRKIKKKKKKTKSTDFVKIELAFSFWLSSLGVTVCMFSVFDL